MASTSQKTARGPWVPYIWYGIIRVIASGFDKRTIVYNYIPKLYYTRNRTISRQQK